MFAALREHIFLILILLIAAPATFHYSIAPIWRAHREMRSQPQAKGSASRQTRVALPLFLGVLVGWAALPMLPEPLFVGTVFGLMLLVITLGWYLVLSAGAFQFGGWDFFFGFGRPVPAKMVRPIQAPIALSILLLLAGGLLGLVLHMLWLSSRA